MSSSREIEESNSNLVSLVSDVYSIPSKNGLTCRTCGQLFEDLASQQQHFKTSIHRSNLIRKLNGLPPKSIHQSTEHESALTIDKPVDDELDADDPDSCSDKDNDDEEVQSNQKSGFLDKCL